MNQNKQIEIKRMKIKFERKKKGMKLKKYSNFIDYSK